MRSLLRTLALALGLAGATAAPALAQFVPAVFDGGGSGSTAESAVFAAIDDAQQTASGFGLFTCELVGDPQVFTSSRAVRPFSAQVRLYCF